MKTGLILEGGAMRGLFTAGVLDVMMENDLKFDGAVGVSAGAAFGCNYKSAQPGRVLRYNLRFCRDPRYCSIRSLIKTGDMFGAEFCYHELPDRLDVFDTDTFSRSEMEFYVVCTDVTTGRPVYHRLDDGGYSSLEWIRASASMPLASRIVDVDGYRLLDGGVSDSIPLKYFQSIGYTRNIVVLTQPKGYIKKKAGIIPAMKLLLGKYPGLIEAMEKRHEMYNEENDYVWHESEKGKTFVIAPDEKLPVGHVEHDPQNIRMVYEIGRNTAKQKIDEIKSFLCE